MYMCVYACIGEWEVKEEKRNQHNEIMMQNVCVRAVIKNNSMILKLAINAKMNWLEYM